MASPIRDTEHMLLSIATLALLSPTFPTQEGADVVVYGGTSAGVIAAVEVAESGRSVLLIAPTGRLGGLSSGGLGATDIGNKNAIGGRSRDFYRRVAAHYADDAAWTLQERDDYAGGGRLKPGDDTMWTFEPHVAEAIFEALVREAGVPVWRDERLDRHAGVKMKDARIVEIKMHSGRSVQGRVFIDATYEGDLLAAAGVSYTVGREGNDEYGETLNGVQTKNAVHHQLMDGIDPYVVPGDSTSGLLPGIDPQGPGEEGSRDARVQAYNLRLCLTNHRTNRQPFTKPDDYDERAFELLFRNFEAGAPHIPWNPIGMPGAKTDTNNNRGFSTDFIGESWGWADASYPERAAIYAQHRSYTEGLLWSLANHPRVPPHVRAEVAKWGTCKDEFSGSGGYSPQLYVREARRMVSDVVMTQHHCQGREVAAHPVGMAAYTMDSHNVQRYVDEEGHVRNEGDVQVGGFGPYPIDYGAIRPRTKECTNLLVPTCISASHIAFGSIRMEPVFMVLGQSSGVAACLAIEGKTSVQAIDLGALRERLLAGDQVLDASATPPPRQSRPGLDPEEFAGIVMDDTDAELVEFSVHSTSAWPWVGPGYLHDGNTRKGAHAATFRVSLSTAGRYEVRIAYSTHDNRASNVPVTVTHAGGVETVRVDQRKKTAEGVFERIGEWTFDAGEAVIVITNEGTDGYVVVDAVQVVEVER